METKGGSEGGKDRRKGRGGTMERREGANGRETRRTSQSRLLHKETATHNSVKLNPTSLKLVG